MKQIFFIDKAGLLCHIGYHLNWMAMDKTDWLLKEKNSYQKNRMAIDTKDIDRTDWLSIEQNGY